MPVSRRPAARPSRALALTSAALRSGLAPHYDDHCVLAMQLSGAKRWRVQQRPMRELPPLREQTMSPPPHACAARGAIAAGEFECVLRAGDVLYVPRGHVHACVGGEGAEGERASMHVTFALEVEAELTWAGLLHEVVSYCSARAGGLGALLQGSPDATRTEGAAHSRKRRRDAWRSGFTGESAIAMAARATIDAASEFEVELRASSTHMLRTPPDTLRECVARLLRRCAAHATAAGCAEGVGSCAADAAIARRALCGIADGLDIQCVTAAQVAQLGTLNRLCAARELTARAFRVSAVEGWAPCRIVPPTHGTVQRRVCAMSSLLG